MRKEIWIHSQTNLLETLEKQDYDTLIQYAFDNEEHIMDGWYNTDDAFFSQILRYGTSQLKYLERHLEQFSKDYAIFQLGTLMGVIKTIEHFFYEKEQQNLTSKLYKDQVLSVKHLDDIILLLESHGLMTHSEICQSLELKESTLSEIMKKAAPTNLIISTKAGKYKLYRLTDNGRYLSKQLRNPLPKVPTKKELLNYLEHYLETSPDEHAFREEINRLVQCPNKTTIKGELAPGDTFTIYHKPNTKIRKEEYRVTGLLNSENTGNLKIMAQKTKYDNIDIVNINQFSNIDIDINNYYEEEDYA